MSTHHWDYIPAKDSELAPWSANFTSQIEANAVAWSISTTRYHIDVLDFRRLKIIFHDRGSDSKAKPYGVNGAVIIYAALDAPRLPTTAP